MNLFLFLSILIFGSATVTFSTIRRSDTKLPALATITLTVFVRVMPNAPPTMHWWRDPHFYLIPTRGLLNAGGTPLPTEFQIWYPQADRQLTWFVMHFISAQIIQITGIDLEAVIRFLPAIWGAVILVLLWALYSKFLDREWALLAAYLTSMLDLIIFYQIEYHAQGVGILFVVLLLFYLSSGINQFDNWGKKLVVVLILFGTAFAHHFTAIASLLFLAVYSILKFVPGLRTKQETTVVPILFLFTLLAAVPHLFVDQEVLTSATLGLIGVLYPTGGAEGGEGVTRAGATILDQLPLLIKAVLGIGSLPALWLAIRHEEEQRPLVVYLFTAGIIAVLVSPIAFGLMNRIILFGYIPLAGLFVHSLWKIVERDSVFPAENAIKVISVVVLVSGLVAASALAAYPPSMVDPSSDVRADGFHEIKPVESQGPIAGEWMKGHTGSDTMIYTQLHTYVIPFYYGEFSTNNIEFVRNYRGDGILLVDTERFKAINEFQVIYSNERITIIKD